MKKFSFSFLSLVLIFTSCIFFGCGNRSDDPLYKYDGYTAVYSATINTLEGKTVYNSICKYELSEIKELSLEEFYNLPTKIVYDLEKETIQRDNTTYILLGDTIRFEEYHRYYSATVVNIQRHYFYVKILNDNKLEIIDNDGNHSLIYAQSYKIDYFEI